MVINWSRFRLRKAILQPTYFRRHPNKRDCPDSRSRAATVAAGYGPTTIPAALAKIPNGWANAQSRCRPSPVAPISSSH